MHLLITRPASDGEHWRAALQTLGVTVSLQPLLEITWASIAPLDLHGMQALIVTSRNALRALEKSAALTTALALPIYTVGQATGDDAARLGFRDVRVGPASARELPALITAGSRPGEGRLLHLSGDKIAFDLAVALTPLGFTIARQEVYASHPVSDFNAATLAELRSGAIDTVALLSPLTARTFFAAARRAQILEQCQRLVYVCLSQNIADEVNALATGPVHVADQPNLDEMLVLISRLAARGLQV
jgi:uroporphyrinogen-III synthase